MQLMQPIIIGGRLNSSLYKPSMEVADLPYDPLAPFASESTDGEQVALRTTGREPWELTRAATMADRLAHALFPGKVPSTVLSRRSYRQPSPELTVHSFIPMQSGIRGVQLHLQRKPGATSGQITRALISCIRVEQSSRLAVAVDMVSETFVTSAESPRRAEMVGAKRGGESQKLGLVNEHLAGSVNVGKWEGDKVGMRFEVSVEGDVAGVTVAFRQGFAERRAGLVGKVLGEVLKDVDASKANLLTQCLAKCEDPGEAGLFSQALAKCGDAHKASLVSRALAQRESAGKASVLGPASANRARLSKEVPLKPVGEAREVSFERNGVRVVTRPRPGPQNMQADLTVL